MARLRRATLWASRLGGPVASLVCAGFVVRAIADEWDSTRRLVTEADAGWLTVGWLLASAAMATMALAWRPAQRIAGEVLASPAQPSLGWFDTVTSYFRGELGKYVPGAIWASVGRAELACRCGVPRFVAYAGVALSLVALYLACALVATATLLLRAGDHAAGAVAWVLVVLPVGAVMLHPRMLGPVLAWLGRRTGQPLAAPSWGQTAGLILRNVPAWLLVAAATAVIARSLTATFDVGEIVLATALAWLAGFLVVGAPGGIGVREAVFVSVASGLPRGVAVAVAVLARLAFITADAGGAALAHAARRLRRSVRSRRGRSPSTGPSVRPGRR